LIQVQSVMSNRRVSIYPSLFYDSARASQGAHILVSGARLQEKSC
jgi:hypothetical protein